MAKKEEVKAYRKLNELEYEVQVAGKTKLITVPFEKVSLLFKDFISNGGIIDAETGQVQTDIISLISSFKDVGNTLLTEFDEKGKVVEEGNCAILSTTEVIGLFQLATSVIENFIKELTLLQKIAEATPNKEESESL